MGSCDICGKPAGFLKDVHKACTQAQAAALKEKLQRWADLQAVAIVARNVDKVAQALDCVAAIGPTRSKEIAGMVFAAQINNLLALRQQPPLEELSPMADFREAYELEPRSIPDMAWRHFVMLVTLADLAAGKFPNRCDDPQLGFVYEPGERIAWVFGGAQYYEDRIQKQSGLYQGMSVRVMPGLYARVGNVSHGEAVEGLVPIAEGNLVVTDRALWFQGPHGVSRIHLSDIVMFQCFDDGFGFCISGHGARNQAFMTGKDEGWFAHDLVTRISRGHRT